jgi:hypothetical protein
VGEKATPWWFPSQTSAGSIREDRLVFPIPPGTHWSDAKPIILPGAEPSTEPKRLPGGCSSKQFEKPIAAPKRKVVTASSGLRFQVANDSVGGKQGEKRPREQKRKKKNDPKYVAAARELRDRYLEYVNAGGAELPSQARYNVGRILPAGASPLALPSAA